MLALFQEEEETKMAQLEVNTLPEFCQRVHEDCGHPCYGFSQEDMCLPCLDQKCQKASFSQYSESNCTICYTDTLNSAPCMEFECKHIFHTECIKRKIEMRWDSGTHIQLQFMDCPMCLSKLASGNAPEDIIEMLSKGDKIVVMVKEKAS